MAMVAKKFGFHTATEWAKINSITGKDLALFENALRNEDYIGMDGSLGVYGLSDEVSKKTIEYARRVKVGFRARAIRAASKTIEFLDDD